MRAQATGENYVRAGDPCEREKAAAVGNAQLDPTKLSTSCVGLGTTKSACSDRLAVQGNGLGSAGRAGRGGSLGCLLLQAPGHHPAELR